MDKIQSRIGKDAYCELSFSFSDDLWSPGPPEFSSSRDEQVLLLAFSELQANQPDSVMGEETKTASV
jgi:hypothetical protein